MIDIPTCFRRTANSMKDFPVLIMAEQVIDFAALDAQSDQLAAALADWGIERGDRIGLLAINSAEFVLAYLGILKAGATVVPINLLLSGREIAFILNDAAVRALFFHPDLTRLVASFIDQLPALSFLGSLGETSPELPQAVAWHQFFRSQSAPPTPQLDATHDIAAILYTSGTTGHPKGAMLTHHNLVSNTHSVVQALHLEPGGDRLLVVLPMFHAFAATVGMLTPLLHGMGIVPLTKFDPLGVTKAIAAHRATVFLGVPSMYSLLLRLSETEIEHWQSIRFCVSGGAALPLAVMQQFEQRFSIPVLEGDGPTECAPVTCVNPQPGPRKPGSVGLPIPGVEMRVLNPQGKPLPRGEIGEVCVRGPNVMRGYWGLPTATAESFFHDWFRTGDLGYADDDGYFFLVDRIKDMIIVNGMNVYPRIIEEVLYRHPLVAEAAVVGEPNDLHGEVPVAHIVLKEGHEVASSVIREYCKGQLGRYEIPKKFIFLKELPKNATGKILKRELRRHGELERGVDSRQGDA